LEYGLLTPHRTSGTISPIGICVMKSGPSMPGNEAIAFAKAMTQYEFGRFYWDERRQNEIRPTRRRLRASQNRSEGFNGAKMAAAIGGRRDTVYREDGDSGVLRSGVKLPAVKK